MHRLGPPWLLSQMKRIPRRTMSRAAAAFADLSPSQAALFQQHGLLAGLQLPQADLPEPAPQGSDSLVAALQPSRWPALHGCQGASPSRARSLCQADVVERLAAAGIFSTKASASAARFLSKAPSTGGSLLPARQAIIRSSSMHSPSRRGWRASAPSGALSSTAARTMQAMGWDHKFAPVRAPEFLQLGGQSKR